MADKLARALVNLNGLTVNKTRILAVPTANFDKCVVTNLGVCNKSGVADSFVLTLVQTIGGAQTVTLISSQPVFANDAFWAKPDLNIHLAAGDEIWIEGKNAGQNLDVVLNYLLSDTL